MNSRLRSEMTKDPDACLDMLDALHLWVHEDEYTDTSIRHLQKLGAMVNKYFPVSNLEIYRATKFELDALPQILSKEPFTIKATKMVRSWSTLIDTADDFMPMYRNVYNEPEKNEVIGIMLHDKVNTSDIFLNLGDERIHQEIGFALNNLYELQLDDDEEEIRRRNHIDEIEKFVGVMEGEFEILRWAKTKAYTLCDDIIKLVYMPEMFPAEINTMVRDRLATEMDQFHFDNYQRYHVVLLCTPDGSLKIDN